VPLILGETATSAHGGCDGLSNTFVAGFTFVYELGSVGEAPGFVQMNRQDIAGFSSQTEPSNYGLLGAPGWARGPIGAPHPDYYTALLFKHLASTVVLNSSVASPDAPAAIANGFDAHAWCGRVGAGIVIVTFTNLLGTAVNITLPAFSTSARRNEYILTSTPTPADAPAPPPSLYNNNVYLNGALLTTNADGTLPVWPFPGRSVAADGPGITVPAWSYGFIELLDAAADGACTGCAGGACGT
jgi:hypothetical protein